jgi:hypothetical protein
MLILNIDLTTALAADSPSALPGFHQNVLKCTIRLIGSNFPRFTLVATTYWQLGKCWLVDLFTKGLFLELQKLNDKTGNGLIGRRFGLNILKPKVKELKHIRKLATISYIRTDNMS